jgi:putative ABC transport system substrate-binding protein
MAELLKKAIPNIARLAVLLNPTYPGNPLSARETQVAVQALGLTLQLVEVREPSEFDNAFAAMTRQHVDTLFVLVAPLLFTHRRRTAELAAKHWLPRVYLHRDHVGAGGLMAYKPDDQYLFRRAAIDVDKILTGAKPGDLPAEQSTNLSW